MIIIQIRFKNRQGEILAWYISEIGDKKCAAKPQMRREIQSTLIH
mgnify:CR=1 FL=1